MHYLFYSSIIILAIIFGALYGAIRVYFLINNKGYEKKFQESFQHGLQDENDKAVQWCQEIINATKNNNPVLINT